MKIESIIRRDGGTSITLGKQEYKFVADGEGRHVCDVDDEAHVERLLSIPEGFKPAEPEPDKAEGEVKAPRSTRKAKPAEPEPDKAEG